MQGTTWKVAEIGNHGGFFMIVDAEGNPPQEEACKLAESKGLLDAFGWYFADTAEEVAAEWNRAGITQDHKNS